MRWPFKLLLALNVLYCVVASAMPWLPAWRMFAAVERLEYSFRDGSGRAIDLRQDMPEGFYMLDRHGLRSVAVFSCRKRSGQGPFTLVERVSGYVSTVDGGSCDFAQP